MEVVAGRTAFVTGGASGIGLGMARAFAEAGMQVVIADIRQDHLDAAAASFPDAARLMTVRLDVTDRAAFAAAADAAEACFGPVHLLCNNAGVAVAGPVRQARWADWDWVLGVNVGGVVNGVQTFVGRMLAHGQGGHIVNTASMSGLLPHANTAGYTMSKAAVIALSEVLASELGPEGVGASAFCPGPVATNIAKAGETRPPHLADTGYAEHDRRRQTEVNRALFMDPLEVGRIVLQGVRENRLYILTHSEFREGLTARCDAILAAVPDAPTNAALMAAYPFLMANPIHAAARDQARKERTA
jgi:NAD(P)-dependent dehydrogenase (short-subunit alcohol dehydrogenase family)